jgi:hypothetical protein
MFSPTADSDAVYNLLEFFFYSYGKYECNALQVRENNAALAEDLMVAGKSGSRDSEGASAEPASTARSRQADHKSKKGGATPLDIARVKAETEALKKQVNRRSLSELSMYLTQLISLQHLAN